MNDSSANQKQQQLLRHTLRALEKIAFELNHYQSRAQETREQTDIHVQYGSQALRTVPDSLSNAADDQPEKRDVDSITDIALLEALLLERVAFFENQYLSEEQYPQKEQLTLLKRSMLLLKHLQTMLEKQKSIHTGKPQPSQIASDTEANRQAQEATDLPPLGPMQRGQTLPLSFPQQRLWFLEQLDPGKPFYNESVTVRLKGSLNIDVLELSFSEIVRRHEILRTTLTNADGETLQRIAPWRPVKLVVKDLQDLPAEEREAQARRMAEAEVEQPFDFFNGPLFKIRLFQLSEEDYLLLTIYHHIIIDGWSISIIYQELSALYKAYLVGEVAPLANLPLQYADYVLWQQQWLQGPLLQEQSDYWQRQLKGAPVQLNLPTDRPRPAIQTYRGAQKTLRLSDSLIQQLKALSQHENVTLFMTLLAAFQVLLMHYSGQQDFLVGAPIANRSRRELENLVGIFVNTLVLRADLPGNPSFQQLLTRVRETTLQAYAHQALPFEKLVAELEPERNLNRQPLFQVAFAFQNFPLSTLKLPGVSWDLLELTKTTSKFDLLMTFGEAKEGSLTTIEYNIDLFEAETIERLLEHWQVLLEAIVSDATRPIKNFSLLTGAEQEHILHMWPPVDQQELPPYCLHQIFEQQAEQTPDSIALVFEETALTYWELNAQANRLANYLQRAGVGPDIFVSVLLERSPELIIALLAILKAGGAYVPLDPASPTEWLAYVLNDARPALVLTQSHLQPNLPDTDCQVVCLDRDQSYLTTLPTANLPTSESPRWSASRLAYMIYTSGSTGKPKGVMVSHANVLRLFSMTQHWFDFQTTDVWTLFHSYAFDFSVWEIWGALLYGGRLLVIPYWVSRSPDEFYRLLEREQVTVLNQTPSAFRQLIQVEAQLADLPALALRFVIFGGEALEVMNLRPWFDRHGDQQPQLVNMYGITETTVHVTHRPLSTRDLCHKQGSVIGGPIPDLQLYVLNDRQQLVPIGVPGELYVGGSGLARGYWQRADITAERFIPHPFSSEPGARLYRTGDLVRCRTWEELEYLGRVDQQVKLRGFRIELGEIESVLHSHPSVRESVVVIREWSSTDKQLVAYIVPAQDARQTTSGAASQNEGQTQDWHMLYHDLRAFLKARLPVYMIPAHFVALERLPLTNNGKIDRKALPAPVEQRLNLPGVDIVAPQTPVQEQLATIWAELLLQPQIDIHSNFFELGGHSLLAMQVMTRIRQAFQVEIPLRSLFEAPTIADLSLQIEQALHDSQKREIPPLLPVSRTQLLPLSFAQQRLWFLDQVEPGNIAYNATYAARLRGQLHLKALRESLHEIVKRHESLRTTFQLHADEPVQIITKMGPSISLIDLSGLAPEAQEATLRTVAQQEARSPFNLALDPLLRTRLLRLNSNEHLLLLTTHHIVFDGWSLDIFSRELSQLYDAFSSGKPSPLAPLPLQYADFAYWQRSWLQGAILDEHIDYWTRQLRGAAPLELPTDYPRQLISSNLGAFYAFNLPAQLSEDLLTLSRQEGVTLFMTLLAAFQTLLYRYTRQLDLVVGTDIANRTQMETEGIIGFFVNLLALRADLSGHPTFREFLKRVRSVVLDAYAHQDLPFEKIVDVLNLERTTHQIPLVRVLFVLQNMPSTALELRGLELIPVQLDISTTKFDLAVFLWEGSQGLSGVVNYRSSLFNLSTIADLVRHFGTLLHSIVSLPDSHLDTLEMFSQAELKQRENDEAALYETHRRKLKTARRNTITLVGAASRNTH